MITYEIKIPITADIREIFFNRNTNKLSYKNDLGIIFPLDPVATSTPTLQQVLTAGKTLTNDANFQGINAGLNNTGAHIVGLGESAGSDNTGGSNVFLGWAAGASNTGSNVVSLGLFAGIGNTQSSRFIVANTEMPTFANHAAAALAITVPLGASAGSTYMYHNQATNSIGAVRL
jgi:hypothetical protein